VLGMEEHLGEKLEAVKKNTKVKNGRSAKYDDKTEDIFNVSY
jgi:site-specific DNA-methyltransferase (adenine-specific)